jgi:hypothetical protein
MLDASHGAQFCLLSDLSTTTADSTAVAAVTAAGRLFEDKAVSVHLDGSLQSLVTTCEEAYRDLQAEVAAMTSGSSLDARVSPAGIRTTEVNGALRSRLPCPH